MPFDYNSFLQGVQTGLRLGRTKLVPQPPVPSGRYILTESGVKVITERIGSGGATFYNISEYPTVFTTTAYSGTQYNASVVFTDLETEWRHYDKDYSPDPAPTNAQYFQWMRVDRITPTISIRNVYGVLLWQGAEYDHDYYSFSTEALAPHAITSIHLDEGQLPNIAGNNRYVTFSYNQVNDTGGADTVYLRNDGAVMFEGTESELAAFIAGLSGMPMITEGADNG